MEIQTNSMVVVDGEQYVVRSTNNGVHGVRCTDAELSEGADLGGRNTVYLGTADELELKGAQIFALE